MTDEAESIIINININWIIPLILASQNMTYVLSKNGSVKTEPYKLWDNLNLYKIISKYQSKKIIFEDFTLRMLYSHMNCNYKG